MSADQEAVKWISLDWSSLRKRVIKFKWGSFNKTQTFSLKTTWVKVTNKSIHLKMIGRHFLSKIKKNLQKKFTFGKIAIDKKL